MIYVRWKRGETRRGKEFDPTTDAEIANMPCPGICGLSIGIYSKYRLFIIGPIDGDTEAKRKMLAGRWFNAGAACMHSECMTHFTGKGLDFLASQMQEVNAP